MKELLELNTVYAPIIVIDNILNKYNTSLINPEKLKQCNIDIEKPGLPEPWSKPLDPMKEHSFWVSGVLNQADANKNTFLITVKSVSNAKQSNFIITTLSETLKELVKTHWGNTLTVYIKPKDSKSKRPKYELLEVKMA